MCKTFQDTGGLGGWVLPVLAGGWDFFLFAPAMEISIGKMLAHEDRGKHHLLLLSCKTVYVFKQNNHLMFLNCISKHEGNQRLWLGRAVNPNDQTWITLRFQADSKLPSTVGFAGCCPTSQRLKSLPRALLLWGCGSGSDSLLQSTYQGVGKAALW